MNTYIWEDDGRRLAVAVAHDADQARVMLLRKYEFVDMRWLLTEPIEIMGYDCFYLDARE